MIKDSCFTATTPYLLTQPMPEEWEFRQADQLAWHRATVPGCVHTDLLQNNLIADPYFRRNEFEQQWIGEKDWDYRTFFSVDQTLYERRQVELVCEGLDTYADIFINGTRVLSADNMFRRWRVEVKPFLHLGKNEIRIYFTSVFHENLAKWASAPFRLLAFANNDQADVRINMYSRKAGFHYGWDWGPRLITCGIWRPIYLQAFDDMRLDDVHYVQQSLTDDKAEMAAVFTVFVVQECTVHMAILVHGQKHAEKELVLQSGIQQITLPFTISAPQRWWCHGLGAPHLYSVFAQISTVTGTAQTLQTNIGLRTLRVVREKDEHGRSFYVELNGIPVFIKGANYIPQDNFQNRVTAQRTEHIVRSAVAANMNMLRVWGGGIYEDDVFYDLCDRYGILIWQEMMFACAMYPVEQEFLDNVQAEVVDNVRRLRNHPCIALYCGNNENEAGWYLWGWKDQYSAEIQAIYEKNMRQLFNEVIPAALAKVDASRYYHPSSPSAGFNGIGYGEGDIHYWGVWHGQEPFSQYKNNIARFVSEYGFQSYPERATVHAFTNLQDRSLHSPVMLAHQRCLADERRDAEYGNRLIQSYLQQSYRIPRDFESYLYLSQVVQAEGVSQAILAHRSARPFCMGSLYWQINDCWPVASWSSIDYYGRWKALHYFAKKAFAPIVLAVETSREKLLVRIISDEPMTTPAELFLTLTDLHGSVLFKSSLPVTIAPYAADIYYAAALAEWLGRFDARQVVLRLSLQNHQRLAEAHHYFCEIKELELPKAKIEYAIQKQTSGYDISLKSDALAKNVNLSTDTGAGFFSDNYFDLFPEEKTVVHYSGADDLASLHIISMRDTYA